MNLQINSYLKTRWGLDWIRFHHSPITFVIESNFIRNIGIDSTSLSTSGASIVAREGVGSFSALVAGTLAAFQKNDIGLYQVKYCTTTSSVGVEILKKHLVSRINELGSKPVNISGVSNKGDLIEIVSDTNNDNLNVDLQRKIKKSAPERTSFDAGLEDQPQIYRVPPDIEAYAAFNLTPPEIINLLNEHARAKKSSNVVIFLHLIQEKHWSREWQEIKEIINNSTSTTRFLICGSEDTFLPLISKRNEDIKLNKISNMLTQETEMSFLIFNDSEVSISVEDQHAQIHLSQKLDGVETARLFSGVLMSIASADLINRLNGPKELQSNLLEHLVFGWTWANSHRPDSEFITEAEILKSINLIQKSRTNEIKTPQYESTYNSQTSPLIDELQKVYSSSNRKNPTEELYQFTQSERETISSAAIDRLNYYKIFKPLPKTSEIRLLFLDLDLTLFDYTLAREKGALAALKELPLSVPLDTALNIYNKISDYGDAFELLGFPNIRRAWNDEISYYFTHLLSSPPFRDKADEFFQFLDSIEEKINGQEKISENLLIQSEIGKDFLENLSLIKGNVELQRDIHRAFMEFEKASYNLQPFMDAREFLTTFSQIDGYYVFIVTEGDASIQWEKIEKLGFQDLITPERFIVTEKLANPQLTFSQTSQDKSQTDVMDDKAAILLHPELEENTLQYYKNLSMNYQHKKNGHFYRQAIHIAADRIRNKAGGQLFANVSKKAWKDLTPVKLAILGDRYTNDIFPLIDILGVNQLLSIRMHYGKYSDEFVPDRSPNPDFTVTNLIQARNILIKDKHWGSKGPIQRPNHFGFEIKDDDLFYAVVGLSMPSPISILAQGILEDVGFSINKIKKLRKASVQKLSEIHSLSSFRKNIMELINF